MTEALSLVGFENLEEQVEAMERDGYAYFPKVLDAAERIKPLAIKRQEQIVAEQRPPMEEPRLAIPA